MQQMKAASAKRVLGLLDDLAKDQPEEYATFGTTFGRVLKEGIMEDVPNRERIAKLLRFASTHGDTEAQTVSLADYVGRMKHDQDAIYYITAGSFAAARNSPHLEIFRKLGIEVLLMYDRIDEWVVSSLTDFEGKPLHSVAKDDLDLGKLGGAASPEAATAADEQSLFERIHAVLTDRAMAVRTTERLTDSPACLVADEHGPSANSSASSRLRGRRSPG